MSSSEIDRGSAIFGDIRGWIDALREADELEEVKGEVDWNVELGNIIRMMQGSGDGPAFLFSNIKDYNGPDALCSRIFTGGHASYSRIAMMFGLPQDTPPRELVRICRTIFQERIEPRTVKDGPVKENVLTGDDIDLLKFPVPKWNRLDGGRYVLTYAGCVTLKIPIPMFTTSVSIAGWSADRRKFRYCCGALSTGAATSPNISNQAAKCRLPMSSAGSHLWASPPAPVPRSISEYDVMGAIRGEPVDLVDCETVPLKVPASAEIVIEGWISTDPSTFTEEGPYAEFTGFYAPERSKKHTTRVTAITHRNDPIFRGTVEGAIPGSIGENWIMSSIHRSAVAWNALENAGVPGVVDVFGHPIQAAVNLNVSINQTYRGQAKQVAAALGGFLFSRPIQACHRRRRRRYRRA